jgi:hypothetical protein
VRAAAVPAAPPRRARCVRCLVSNCCAPDCREIITEWLADAHKRTLVFTETLVAGYGYSKFTGKTKTLAFVKRDGIEKSLTNKISNEVVVHETQKPVQELEKIVQEIYLPLLTNTKNQEGWGDVASKEIITKLHNFLSSCSITVGNTEGKTFLPLPPFEVSEDRDENKTRISLIESSIITWTDQIKKILKMDPEMPLKMGLNPTPDAEVDFWRTKSAHLNAIYDQLQSPQDQRGVRGAAGGQRQHQVPAAALRAAHGVVHQAQHRDRLQKQTHRYLQAHAARDPAHLEELQALQHT